MKPFRIPIIVVAVLMAAAIRLPAQDAAIKSGPPAGGALPGSFAPYNLNGKIGKYRQHCLVCEFNLDPVVLVFVREPAPGKDMVLNDFFQQLEKAVDRHEPSFLRCFVVYLSPASRSSVDDPDIQDAGKLVDEATLRKQLMERLAPRAEAAKNIVYAVCPAEGPKEYKIDPKAQVTVIFYKRHRVLANFAFALDAMAAADADAILRSVDKLITIEPLDK